MSVDAVDRDMAARAQQAQQNRAHPLWLRRGEVLLAIMDHRGDYQQLAPLRAELSVVDAALRALGETP